MPTCWEVVVGGWILKIKLAKSQFRLQLELRFANIQNRWKNDLSPWIFVYQSTPMKLDIYLCVTQSSDLFEISELQFSASFAVFWIAGTSTICLKNQIFNFWNQHVKLSRVYCRDFSPSASGDIGRNRCWSSCSVGKGQTSHQGSNGREHSCRL